MSFTANPLEIGAVSMGARAACLKRAFEGRERTGVKLAVLLVLAFAVIVVAALAELIVPYDPYAQDLGQALQAPNWQHPAGTDRYGRDMLSRIIVGAQSSVFCTLALVAIIAVVGLFVGMAAGWRGGAVDVVLMRVSDVFLAFPGLVFALAVAGVLGGGMHNAVIALAAISWPKYARIARGLTLSVKNEDYLSAARLSGCRTPKLIARHVMPNIIGPVLVTAVLDIGTMLMELAGLSFLGLGAQPPMAEWGSMMSDNRNLLQTSPRTVIAPGIAIFLVVVVFNLLGDTLRDWFDPNHRDHGVRRRKTRGREDRGKGLAVEGPEAASSVAAGCCPNEWREERGKDTHGIM